MAHANPPGSAPGSGGMMAGKIGGIPKPLAIGGVVFAVILGLWMRSRNAASSTATSGNSDSSSGGSTDSGSYIPPVDQSSDYSSPYDPYSALSSLSSATDPYSALIAAGVDPTTAANAAYYEETGTTASPSTGLSSTASDTPATGTASAPAASSQTPVVINLGGSSSPAPAKKKATVTRPASKPTVVHRTPGKPKVSARPKSLPTHTKKKLGNG